METGDHNSLMHHLITSANRMIGAERGAVFQIEKESTGGEFALFASKNLANEQIDDLQLTATDLVSAEGTSLSGALLDVRIVKRWYQRNYGGNNDPADLRVRYMTPELLVYDDTLIKVEGNDKSVRTGNRGINNFSYPEFALFII